MNKHDACVSECMSVEEARAGERGRECESEIERCYVFILYLLFILNVLS